MYTLNVHKSKGEFGLESESDSEPSRFFLEIFFNLTSNKNLSFLNFFFAKPRQTNPAQFLFSLRLSEVTVTCVLVQT
jgi:hypothetical protein